KERRREETSSALSELFTLEWSKTNNPHVECFSQIRKLRRSGFSDQVKYFFHAPRASQGHDPQRCTGSIAPCMRNSLSQSHDISRLNVEYPATVRNTRCPFQDDNVFILSLMNMHWGAVARVRYNFDQ